VRVCGGVRVFPRSRAFPDLWDLESSPLTEEAVAESDLVLLVTNHRAYDYGWLASHARLIVDTRNAFAGVKDPRARIVKA